MEKWGVDHYGSHVTSLKEDQKNAIGFYKDKGFRQINPFLRGINNKPIDENVRMHLNNLKTIYKDTPPCKENVVLYRSDHTQQWFNNAIGNAQWNQAEGMIFTLDKAFLSTALRQEAAKVFQQKPKKVKSEVVPITYKILYPQGTKTACYLDCLEHKHKTEREMLFKPEAKFKILMTDIDKGEVTLLALND